MESVTCCFLTGLEVLAKVSKQCGAGVELEQEPVPVSAASWGPETPAARKCAWGRAWTERHRTSVCGGEGAVPLPWGVCQEFRESGWSSLGKTL